MQSMIEELHPSLSCYKVALRFESRLSANHQKIVLSCLSPYGAKARDWSSEGNRIVCFLVITANELFPLKEKMVKLLCEEKLDSVTQGFSFGPIVYEVRTGVQSMEKQSELKKALLCIDKIPNRIHSSWVDVYTGNKKFNESCYYASEVSAVQCFSVLKTTKLKAYMTQGDLPGFALSHRELFENNLRTIVDEENKKVPAPSPRRKV